MGFFSSKDPEPYFIKDKPFICTACGHNRFRRRRALLNTALATFFEMDWANRSAQCMVCAECGYVHWFLPKN